MHFSQLFRCLNPAQLKLVVGEFGNEPGFYDGLIEYEASGLEARLNPNGKIGSLKAEISDPLNDNQRRNFTACLAYFQLPFTPDATFKAVGASLNSILPRMLTARTQKNHRHIAGLTKEGVAVSCHFEKKQLKSIEITDLHQRIVCDRFDGASINQIPEERAAALKRLKDNPDLVFFHYIGPFDAESIEWNRDLSPVPQLERPVDEEEVLPEEWLPS